MGICRTARSRTIAVWCTGLCMMAVGIGLIPIIDVIVDRKVRESVILKEGGLQYDIWRNMTIPVYIQFYMFDLKNPDEVHNGETPDMEQKGPYTYRETRYKVNITHHDNGTVSYRQIRVFKFDRNMSVGEETDQFTTVNPPLMTLLTALKFQSDALRKLISGILRLTPSKLFMTRPMKEIIWGYQDPLLKVAKGFDPEWFYTDFVGYFINYVENMYDLHLQKNNTDDGVYTVHTGETDINLLGVIDKYNGSSYLDFWSTSWANMVNGTDGTIAPPFIQEVKKLPTFSSDVCRSVYGLHSSDVKTSQGIPLHRFTGNQAELGNITMNPDNIGFCTPQTNCFGTGVLNVSACQSLDYFQIPAVVSFPHFYLAEDKYVHGVYGMSPNKEEHETAIDVEPLTGLVLQAAKRLQINMHVVPIPDVQQTANIKPVVMPIFWVNESAAVDDVHAQQLQDLLFTPLLVTDILKYGLIGVGAALFLSAAIYAIWFVKSPERSTNGSERSGSHLGVDNPDETTPLLYDEAYTGCTVRTNRPQEGSTSSPNIQEVRDATSDDTPTDADNVQGETVRCDASPNTDNIQEGTTGIDTPSYSDIMQGDTARCDAAPETDNIQEGISGIDSPSNSDIMQGDTAGCDASPNTDNIQEGTAGIDTPSNSDIMQGDTARCDAAPETDNIQEGISGIDTASNSDIMQRDTAMANIKSHTDNMQNDTAELNTPHSSNNMQEDTGEINSTNDNMQNDTAGPKTPSFSDNLHEDTAGNNTTSDTDNMQNDTSVADRPSNTDNVQKDVAGSPQNFDRQTGDMTETDT